MSRRIFKSIEIATAIRMRREGASWKKIARAIGRKDRKGIRCRLDPEFQAKHNAYHADYKRKHRDSAAKKEKAQPNAQRHAIKRDNSRPITLPKMPWDRLNP